MLDIEYSIIVVLSYKKLDRSYNRVYLDTTIKELLDK
jgi:hypothetical protein